MAGLAGKRCLVIGSNTIRRDDICVILWEHDAQVTMIQRSPTIVVRADTMREVCEADPITRSRAPTRTFADLMGMTMPLLPAHRLEKGFTDHLRAIDADFTGACRQRLSAPARRG